MNNSEQDHNLDISELNNRIEYLTQIIEDLYVNYKIGTLDNHMGNLENLKEIIGIINKNNRMIEKYSY